jgi:hypothetical protein
MSRTSNALAALALFMSAAPAAIAGTVSNSESTAFSECSRPLAVSLSGSRISDADLAVHDFEGIAIAPLKSPDVRTPDAALDRSLAGPARSGVNSDGPEGQGTTSPLPAITEAERARIQFPDHPSDGDDTSGSGRKSLATMVVASPLPSLAPAAPIGLMLLGGMGVFGWIRRNRRRS